MATREKKSFSRVPCARAERTPERATYPLAMLQRRHMAKDTEERPRHAREDDLSQSLLTGQTYDHHPIVFEPSCTTPKMCRNLRVQFDVN